MRNIQFVNEQIYHIYNRGVEKRQIFMDDNDYFRFIHDLFEFNDTAPAGKFSSIKHSEAKPPTVKKRKMLVEILCFCLMPNHFHLILRQLQDNGITLFMHKLGTGYTGYFNDKHERVGSLFQGTFKAIIVADEEYFLQLGRYIHLNSLELINPEWKIKGIGWERANKFLEAYRWSSYPDYIGKKNFPSVISKGLLRDLFPNPKSYKKFVNQYLVGDLNEINSIILE